MALEVVIDRDVCMGSGNCLYQAPGAFDLDDDAIAFVADLSAATEAQVLEAAAKCPARAITVRAG